MAGFLAITGSPPFGLFISELTILKGIIDGHHIAVAVIYLSALAVVFVGMASIMLKMIYTPPEETLVGNELVLAQKPPSPFAPRKNAAFAFFPIKISHEPLWSILSPMMLGLLVLGLGLYVPPELANLMRHAAEIVGGK
jgi:hydrogenase-4 component F